MTSSTKFPARLNKEQRSGMSRKQLKARNRAQQAVQQAAQQAAKVARQHQARSGQPSASALQAVGGLRFMWRLKRQILPANNESNAVRLEQIGPRNGKILPAMTFLNRLQTTAAGHNMTRVQADAATQAPSADVSMANEQQTAIALMNVGVSPALLAAEIYRMNRNYPNWVEALQHSAPDLTLKGSELSNDEIIAGIVKLRASLVYLNIDPSILDAEIARVTRKRV